MERDAKKYNRIKIGFGIAKAVVTFVLILLFVYLGYSQILANYLSNLTENKYLVFILFVVATASVAGILFSPLSFYLDFYLEHKYNLSNQTFFQWIWENAKGMLVAGIIGLPILLLFYWTMNYYSDLWWLPFAIIIFLFSVVLAKIVPIVILPIFYKITPIEDEELKTRIISLTEGVKLNIENVFKFDMSKNTKKANAAFTGLGKTKRIILGDTLLESFSKDEIETIIAHEIGHFKHKHIFKNIVIGTISSFLTLFLIATFYKHSLGYFGFSSITEIAALPLLSLWGMIIGLIQSPISAGISRKYEYEADKFAVIRTEKADEFISALEKLNEQNLGDKDPHPLVEFFFYSHPSIKKRVAAVKSVVL